MSDIGGIFVASTDAAVGIHTGALRIVGSVVRHASGPLKGKIHSYLQETGVAGALLESVWGAGSSVAKSTMATGNPIIGAGVGAAQLASSVAGNIQNEIIRTGVNRLETKVVTLASGMQTLNNLGVANLALSAIGIGVSLVGFGMLNARLSRVETAIVALTESTDKILAAVERIRQDQLASEFSALRSQVKLYEEAWLMANHERASQLWLDVAQAVRPHQDRFEGRARELLFAMPPEFELADPIIDALALAGGLRVACLMACNESEAAISAASENARQIEGLTGAVGKADLALARIPSSIDRASPEWADTFAAAASDAAPIAERWRQREAIAATRAAPFAQLKRDAITPREWLKAAREEKNEPVLLLKATE